ncbi:hypothetical protein Vadar_028507 [Vaccinium darrowii]|uniref:Uncharacterized protein n=1 Tax=Vaccinium darrowii TaxID=229202 RepID=A0ACB7X4R7_9ERIC|nr:hypothetical protein Vadar_028507 [Vaccinium darrowii]
MKHQSLSFLTPSLPLTIFIFFITTSSVSSVDRSYESCVPQNCGNQTIRYPFWIKDKQEPYCGYPGFEINCQNNSYPILQTPQNNYTIQEIQYKNQSIRLSNAAVWNLNHGCWPPIGNVSLEVDKFIVVTNRSEDLFLLSNCTSSLGEKLLEYRIRCGEESGNGDRRLAMFGNDKNLEYGLESCQTRLLVPVELQKGDVRDYLGVLRRGFLVEWKLAPNCNKCEDSGGRCGIDFATYQFSCFCTDRPHRVRCHPGKRKLKLILGTVIPGGVILVLSLIIVTIWWCKKRKNLSYIFSKNTSSDPSSRTDPERGCIYFGVSVFSYTELQEATNNFDASKELGDGGFGTVYHGILRDGREVAVKRLYEHNYKRMTQFMNEIEILARLRHPNLVSLYGCTSRQSKELLLVYDFIPNGTVADHLHVDISRHRHEINLANWAINRIQNHAFNELIDPSLGFESDSSIERMTQSVAEVAFRCLQLEKEMRPTMEEVLEALKEIQEYKEDKISDGEVTSKRIPPSPEADNVVLLKSSKAPPSPYSVTERWVSCPSTTSISSG